MEFIDPDSVKRMARAREHMLKFQQRIFKLEYLLEDLTRSVEIARYSGQYTVTEVFTRQAEQLLLDRLTLPEVPQSDQDVKYTVVEGTLTSDHVNDVRSKHGMDAVTGVSDTEISGTVRTRKAKPQDSASAE
jgi:hypothetical protein